MKYTFWILLAVFVGFSLLWYARKDAPAAPDRETKSAISVEESGDAQILTLTAKGGYTPSTLTARADTPTTLIVTTQGTFDCSSALVIPAIKYRTNLPPTGETKVSIPPQKAGTTLRGSCSMGMYHFEIRFE